MVRATPSGQPATRERSLAARLRPSDECQAQEVISRAAALRHPTRGIMRGVHSEDSDKLINITVGELRLIDRFITVALNLANQENDNG